MYEFPKIPPEVFEYLQKLEQLASLLTGVKMTKTVEILLKRGSIFLPVSTEIDTMYEDKYGFVISIFTVEPIWQDATGFPHYIGFTYDKSGEPQPAVMSNSYSEIVEFWHENFGGGS